MSTRAPLPLMITHLRKSFGKTQALTDINLEVKPGQVLALLGASGCGKTTLLRCIAGLLAPDAGRIAIHDQIVASDSLALPPEQRHLGMVFQDYALWPHMTVAENLAFPLTMQRIPKKAQKEQIRWALDMVGLSAMADRQPGTLSGGQQQRVALARAVVARPKLLLMDEPLSNLDKGLREQLAGEIRELIDELGLTAVFVTHDQHEAFALADQIAVMQGGQIVQMADPETLFRLPASPDIASFLDAGTLLEGRLSHRVLNLGGQSVGIEPEYPHQGAVRVLLPRGAFRIDEKGELSGRICARVYQGEHYAVRVRLDGEGGQEIKLHLRHAPVVGTQVRLSMQAEVLCAWREDNQPLKLRRMAGPLVRSA